MGLEFDMYEITALTLMRNDSRAERFSANLQELEQRARSLPASPHWLKTPRDVVCAFSLNRTHHHPPLHVFFADCVCDSGRCIGCRA
jgi:hypothetical protein